MKVKMIKIFVAAVATLTAVNARCAMPSSAEVMNTAEKVASYFMTTTPDVGATSKVGGKVRNSRIWTRGVFYEGLLNMYREEQRPDWLKYCVDWGEFHNWYSCTDEQATHADFQCCGQSYIEMYQLDPTRKERIEHIKMRIDNMLASDRINYWTWIDAVQMAMPIFIQLGTITGSDAYYDRAYEMYAYTRDRQGGSKKGGGQPLFNEKTGLWYRDYQFDPPYKDKVETDKDCYWSRGNGWIYMALARVMQFSDATEAHRAEYESDFRQMSLALIDCQRSDGFWSVSLAAPTNFGAAGSEGPEITGTALFVGGLAYGIRSGLLDADTYQDAVERGWAAMKRSVHNDTGFVGYMQGTGSAPEHGGPITFDHHPDFEDFGIGCWLWGAAEVHALARKIEAGESGVGNVTIESDEDSGEWFDLMGRRVVNPVEGQVYIHNRKLTVKGESK